MLFYLYFRGEFTGIDKAAQSEIKAKHDSSKPSEKRTSPIFFGAMDSANVSHPHSTTNGVMSSTALSSGNIAQATTSTLKKSHSTGYQKVNVMGKIKDRAGVPV